MSRSPAAVWLLAAALAVPRAARAADDVPSAAELQWALNRVDALLPYLVRKRAPAPGEVELGRELFFDPRLSSFGAMSCSTCHQPAQTFSDGLPRAVGRGHKVLARNTPSIAQSRYRRFLFWDGRASSVGEAALNAIQNPEEMSQDLPGLESRLAAIPGYAESFRSVYGASVTARGVGEALAAYIGQLPVFDSPFDRFHQDGVPLPPAAQRGLVLFAGKANCVRCHASTNFTAEAFYDLGLSTGPSSDPGRFAVTHRPEDRGAFRVPSLRNVARTAPYMHDGRLRTLREVVEFFDRGGDSRSAGSPLEPLGLSEREKGDVVAFLESLSSRVSTAAAPALPLAADPPAPAARAPDTARAAGAIRAWDGLADSIKFRVYDAEGSAPWSARLPVMPEAGRDGCESALTMARLLERARAGRWQEADPAFVRSAILGAAERYYLYVAVARADAGQCAPLAAFDRPAGIGERVTLDASCRERYFEMRFAQALQGIASDPRAACVESLSHQPTLGAADAGAICGLILAHREEPEKACAAFQPAYLDVHQVRACAMGLRTYLGEARNCAEIADLQSHLIKRCELYPKVRRAALAKDPAVCGASADCRALMGEGAAQAAAVERDLVARACGVGSAAADAEPLRAIARDLDRAGSLLSTVPPPWRESRSRSLENLRGRWSALRVGARRSP